MSYSGAAALAPSCIHAWGDQMRCLRCRVTLQDYYAQRAGLQESGQLKLSWPSDSVVRVGAWSIEDLRQSARGGRRHTRFADPVAAAPKDPVHTVVSVLPHLLLAWALIWLRWLLPPKGDE